jgi:hypothetical protein
MKFDKVYLMVMGTAMWLTIIFAAFIPKLLSAIMSPLGIGILWMAVGSLYFWAAFRHE